MPRQIDIKVSAKILRHISRGIYRTPAAALKELVSNAHDARATAVTINTGFPIFEKIVVTDDGDGMTSGKFETMVQHIGLSEKIAGQDLKLPTGKIRKVIGHYGIGILAVGQLASKMKITSKQKNSSDGFLAEMDFDQFENRLDNGIERSKIKNEREAEENDHLQNGDPKFTVGKCRLTSLKFDQIDKNKSFTKIELFAIRSEVQNKLAGKYKERNSQTDSKLKYVANFNELLKLLREREGETKQGQYPYERLCWELAVYCPIPYPKIDFFRNEKKMQSVVDEAESHRFSVVIDGVRLAKPFELDFFKSDPPIQKIWSWIEELPEDLKVTGYIIFKPKIRPKIQQGILLRESGVAVGLYDSTFMEYPFNEGFKFGQLTGELFVEGLSGALNIDRNSFNETDDKYLALSTWLHNKLQNEVFPFIKKHQKGPGASRRESNRNIITSKLLNMAKVHSFKINKVKFASSGSNASLFSIVDSKLIINTNHPAGKGSSAQSEMLVLAATLVMSGVISVSKINDILSQIKNSK
jgi:hypothetical protein